MRIVVTGANGLLGSDIAAELEARGHVCICSGRAAAYSGKSHGAAGVEYVQLDLCDARAVQRTLDKCRPDAVVHCAAWTDVEAAELPENRSQVFAVNAGGTKNVAEACRRLDCKMLYISSDYVFGGAGSEPYRADCVRFAPLNVYGQSKLDGERAVLETLKNGFIVRTSWLYGLRGPNFVKTMLRLGRSGAAVRVVNDQIGTPTYSVDLARLLVDLVETEKYGCYHATNACGYISWYEFACEIFRQAGIQTTVIPVTTEEYGPAKAARPHNSRLDTGKLVQMGFQPLPDWKNALRRCLMAVGDAWDV